MTVNTANSSAAFSGNGVTVLFPFTFRFFANTDLVVVAISAVGVVTTLVLGVDYSAQGAGNDAGGSVTTTVPPATGVTLNVSRVLAPTQLVSIRNQGKFFAGLHEDVFDYLTMLIQQSLNNTGSALLFPLSDPPGLLKSLPTQMARANKMLAFDATGQTIASNLTLAELEQQPTASAASAELARKWAENPVDTPVVTGKFSSLHWATKSSDSATAASGSASNANTSAINAATSETNAANTLLTAQKQIQTVGASVAANALSLSWTRTGISFRSATLSSGAVNNRNPGANLTLTIPSGATLGTTSGVSARILHLLIDNAGTVELAAINLAGGVNLDETGIINTVAVSGASNSANVAYSTTARSNVPYRVVGFVDIVEATAGTWATAPTLVQGIGGQALAALGSIGFGQTEQLFTVGSTRVNGTTYTNLTGKPIEVCIMFNTSVAVSVVVGGVTKISGTTSSTSFFATSFIVPPGATYIVNGAIIWSELR